MENILHLCLQNSILYPFNPNMINTLKGNLKLLFTREWFYTITIANGCFYFGVLDNGRNQICFQEEGKEYGGYAG